MKDTLVDLLKNRFVWVGILLILGLNFVGKMDLEDHVQQSTHYCTMVKLYQDTNGQSGWFDYEGTYTQHCTQEESSR